jgi:hypothetical protein
MSPNDSADAIEGAVAFSGKISGPVYLAQPMDNPDNPFVWVRMGTGWCRVTCDAER